MMSGFHLPPITSSVISTGEHAVLLVESIGYLRPISIICVTIAQECAYLFCSNQTLKLIKILSFSRYRPYLIFSRYELN